MSRDFPDWVNPLKAAEGKRIFSGTIPLERLARLKPMLAAVRGEAAFTAGFALDEEQRATLSIEVSAELPLTCQASLETFLLPVSRSSLLAVVEDESEQDTLPGHYEPAIAEGGRLQFAALVEDELLLAIPQVPRKPGTEAVRFSTDPEVKSARDEPAEDHHRPFAALKDMLSGEGPED